MEKRRGVAEEPPAGADGWIGAEQKFILGQRLHIQWVAFAKSAIQGYGKAL